MEYADSLTGNLIKKIKKVDRILVNNTIPHGHFGVLTTCHFSNKKHNLTMKWYFDVEDEEDKEDVQSPPLTTTKTQKHSNVTLKNMIAEKIEKNVSSFAVYINQKLPSSVIGKNLKIGNTNVYRKKNNRHNIIYLYECQIKMLTQNSTLYSNIPERNTKGLAAASIHSRVLLWVR